MTLQVQRLYSVERDDTMMNG